MTTVAGAQVRGIDNVLFDVADLDSAVRFYSATLGLPLAFRVDEAGIALFRLGAETPGLLVRQPRPEQPSGGGRVWLEVPDARSVVDALEQAGVPGRGEPFRVATGWTVEVADPWGNVVGFTDYTSMPERGRISG